MKYLAPILFILACLCGCDVEPQPSGVDVRIGDRRIQAPPGHTVEIEGTDDIGSEMFSHKGEASGVGAGLDTETEKAAIGFNASAPFASLLNAPNASGGSSSITQTLTGGSQASFLMWAAIAIGLGSIPVFIWVNKRAGVAMFGFAGVLIVAAMLPQWAWIVIAFASLAGAGVYVYAERDVKKKDDALGVVTGGVEDLTDTPRQLVKAAIAARAAKADTNVGKTIAKIKAKKGLPSERH